LGRLGVFSGRQVCVILMRHGFEMIRQRGSHVVMQRTLSGSTITVPVPAHDEIKPARTEAVSRNRCTANWRARTSQRAGFQRAYAKPSSFGVSRNASPT